MLAEVLVPIPTRKGTLQPGQLIDLPAEVVERFEGKICLALPGGLTFVEVETEFSQDPDWPKLKNDPRWIQHLAETIHTRRFREKGQVPPSYSVIRECRRCGPVWLEAWVPQEVIGCPWCLNFAKGLPIPRP